MCGIAVMVALDGRPAEPAVLERMSAAMRHRGPDDDGSLVSGNVGLGFRRLSILDLSPAGHQPMLSHDGELALVFNGEIYNYVELRKELRAQGAEFHSSGDSEVLLRAYETWGTDCVNRFNGMWAFALLDRRRGKIVLSRDRLGVKPLFRCRTASHLLFASELKAIVASGLVAPRPDWHVASRFLVRGELDTDERSLLDGVERVPAGAIVEVDADGRESTRRFWRLGESPTPPADDPAKAFRDVFEDSVRLRLRSDVPVGVFLSGGLDSTSILSVMSRQLPDTAAVGPTAFTYQAPDFDEKRFIDDTIRQTRASLQEFSVPPARLWESVERMLQFQDEPVHSPTAVIGFELMKMARSSGVTVILNGQGADETLAGYHSYFREYWYSLASSGSWGRTVEQIRAYADRHGKPVLPVLADILSRMVTRPFASQSWYRNLAASRQRRAESLRRMFRDDLTRNLAVDVVPDGDPFAEALRASVERKPLPLYLRVEDRNSMAHSVEARLPFCDYRVASTAWDLPIDWKLRGPWNKFVLREAMQGVIPESVRTRADKMGFPTSARRWIANEWFEPIRELVLGSEARARGIYDMQALEGALAEHRSGSADRSGVLFRVAQFELLCRMYRW